MRLVAAILTSMATLSLASGVANASWSTPSVLSTAPSSPFAAPAVAVDSRGDTAVAWETVGRWPSAYRGRRCGPSPTRRGCLPVSSVHLSVRLADRRLIKRTLWSSRINPTITLSVALDRDQTTVAWGYSEVNATYETARAAYGPLVGRWAPSEVLSHFSGIGPFFDYPRLAITPHGEVLAVWNACKSRTCLYRFTRGVDVAWRAPGHGFGSPRLIANAPLGAYPQIDAHGTAYLVSGCSGRVLVAPAPSHSFGKTLVLAQGPVQGLTLSLSGAGQGLAAWISGVCSLDEAVGNTPGPVFESVLHAGTFSTPRMLTSVTMQAVYARALAVGSGGTVSWFTETLGFLAYEVQIGAGGVPGATQQGDTAIIPWAVDGGGDVVFARAPVSGPLPMAVFVAPAGGAPDETAPATNGLVATAAFGRAIALVWWNRMSGYELSVWRP